MSKSKKTKSIHAHNTLSIVYWLRGPAAEHQSLAGVLSLSCARPVADG